MASRLVLVPGGIVVLALAGLLGFGSGPDLANATIPKPPHTEAELADAVDVYEESWGRWLTTVADPANADGNVLGEVFSGAALRSVYDLVGQLIGTGHRITGVYTPTVIVDHDDDPDEIELVDCGVESLTQTDETGFALKATTDRPVGYKATVARDGGAWKVTSVTFHAAACDPEARKDMP